MINLNPFPELIPLKSDEQQSIAINRYSRHETKAVQREAKVLDQYVKDIEIKFEIALFKADPDLSYIDLFIYFLKEWKRICKAISARRFQHVSINENHFINQYAPRS
tara:strand:+ start:5820 stop:6140 length:321 start_codon:yes stop_codon:yes gene_type:complete